MGVIACKDLSKWYGEVIAVNDVTFDLQPGITGLLGPNGAGKSSLLRMAVGLQRPSAGSLRVLDEDPWDNAALLRRVGYVPEGDAPWRDLSGQRAAVLAARLGGLSGQAAEDAAQGALRQVGLQGVQERRVEAYSRGTRQKLKLALALLRDPELLVLDEPLLGSDPMSRRDLIQLIRELAKQGKSALVSTHVLPDVEAMTTRIVLLNHGRLMAHGEVPAIRDLLERYPRTVRVATPQPRELGALVWGWDSVLSVQAEEGAVVVRTKRPQEFFEALQQLLVSKDIPFTSVTSPDDNVEAVFRYLVGA
jgi:ABC-2 type transport system ATP-binding protein